ncbi:MAG: hypothetical protein CM15mP120_06320 [Pseudomonadota bacterium]|nr:MAG: hypothetical protein CM15mP120_06320 [Pseudomonadota bacterium]
MQAAGLPMQSIVWPDWQLAALDSHEDDKPKSLITEIDRQALSQAVAGTQSGHILLATHHPLVEVHSPWLARDRIVAFGAVELAEPAKRRTSAGVVFGHTIKRWKPKWGGAPYLVCFDVFSVSAPKLTFCTGTILHRAING